MLWNRFDTDRKKLNLYDDPHYEEGSGITDREELICGVMRVSEALKGAPHPIIKARAFAYVLESAAIEVNPCDWFGFNLCGWLTTKGIERANEVNRKRSESGKGSENLPVSRSPLYILNIKWISEVALTPEFKAASANIRETGAGTFGPDYEHSVPDWDSAISLSFSGLLSRAKRIRSEKGKSNTLTDSQRVYYESVEITYEALVNFVKRLLDCARLHIDEDEKMPIVVDCLETISTGAPKTMYQMLVLTYLFHLIQQHIEGIQVRTLGNLDVDCYPYYTDDLKCGRLTPENAKELFRYF